MSLASLYATELSLVDTCAYYICSCKHAHLLIHTYCWSLHRQEWWPSLERATAKTELWLGAYCRCKEIQYNENVLNMKNGNCELALGLISSFLLRLLPDDICSSDSSCLPSSALSFCVRPDCLIMSELYVTVKVCTVCRSLKFFQIWVHGSQRNVQCETTLKMKPKDLDRALVSGYSTHHNSFPSPSKSKVYIFPE